MKYILIIEKCFLLSLLLLTLVGCDNNVYHWEFRYDYEQIMEIKIIEFDDDVLFDDSNIVEISEFKYKFIKNVDYKLFKEINKKMDELDKRVDKIAKRIGKGETNEEIEAIGMQHRELYNQLLVAQNERIEQLRHEYETGKISKYYYEKRVEQVNTLQNLEQIPPLFEIDEPQYKDFKTYKKHVINEIMKKIENGEEAKMPENDEELKEEYKRVLDRLECDKLSYLADRVLNDNGIKVLKSLSSENKFAVSSQLLNINEEVYREEYTQYIEHNQKVNTQLLSQEQPQADGLLAPEPIEVPDASVEAIQINEQVQPIEEKLEIDELPYDMQRKNTNVV